MFDKVLLDEIIKRAKNKQHNEQTTMIYKVLIQCYFSHKKPLWNSNEIECVVDF